MPVLVTIDETKYAELLNKAYELAKEALELLDLAGAPSHIAAHFDLGLHRLEDILPGSTETAT